MRILRDNRGITDFKPQAMTKTKIDDLIADGGQEWWHGFASGNGRKYAAEFMAGQFAPGRGTFGSGFYTGTGLAGRAVAYQYTGLSKEGEHNPGSVVMRGAMLPTARVYGEDAINRDFTRDRNAYLRAYPHTTNYQGEHHFQDQANQAVWETFYNDIGRYAAAKGYDSVGEKGMGLIVNPQATAVQRSLLASPKSERTIYRDSIDWRVGNRLSKEYARARAEGRKPPTRAQERMFADQERARFAQQEQDRIDRFRTNRDQRRARAAAKAMK